MISALKLYCKLLVLFVFAGAMLLGRSVAAQRNTEIGKAMALLSPDGRTVADRLTSLGQLPQGSWKMHAGDVAHGEDTNLDDSSWPTIKLREKAPNEAVWFRQTVQVPESLNGYDLTGARIWFEIDVNGNGPMPEIIYFNGRRVALGEDLEPIILFDQAKPGDKVLVAVKLAQTAANKTFTAARLKIDFSATRPNPDDLRSEFISAAALIPRLSKAPAQDLATLQAAIADVDLKALDANNASAFDASLVKASTQLNQLKPMLQQATLHITGNSHIDAAWLWPESETMDVVKRTFSTALQLMNEYPDYHYTQSAAQYNEWMADKYPAIHDEIRKRIKEGRWEVVGGMWVEPDLNMPDGESQVRSLLLGKRFFQQQYGVDVRIGWNPDSFGYNWQLPQIYKRSGLDYFVTQKMHWNDTNQLPFRLFWWQSPDGSKVLTYFPTDYVHDNVNPTRISADFAESAQRNPGTAEMLDLYGIGDHGGGPTRAMLDQADHWITMSHPQNSVMSSSQNSVILSGAHSAESKDLHNTSPPQAPSTLSSTGASGVEGGFSPPSAANKEGALAPASTSAAKGQRPDIYQPGPQAQVVFQRRCRGLKARHIVQQTYDSGH